MRRFGPLACALLAAWPAAAQERNVPMTAEPLLDAGSIRKQFVAAAILMLVEEGKLSLTGGR